MVRTVSTWKWRASIICRKMGLNIIWIPNMFKSRTKIFYSVLEHTPTTQLGIHLAGQRNWLELSIQIYFEDTQFSSWFCLAQKRGWITNKCHVPPIESLNLKSLQMYLIMSKIYKNVRKNQLIRLNVIEQQPWEFNKLKRTPLTKNRLDCSALISLKIKFHRHA